MSHADRAAGVRNDAIIAGVNTRRWGAITMKSALLIVIFMVVSYPAIAKQRYYHPERATTSHPRITCEMVRAYVAQIGLAQAKAMAQAAGMTESEEREAVQCLERKI